MSLTPIKLFDRPESSLARDQRALADELAAAIEALTRQLQTLRFDANRNAADLRGTTTKQLLQHAQQQLEAILREIKLRATPQAEIVVNGIIQANPQQALPLTISFLQEKAQQVGQIYQQLMTHDTFKQKSSANVLVAVTELFAKFFEKIADYFRKQECASSYQGSYRGSWKPSQSPAQKNIAGQFAPVLASFEQARTKTLDMHSDISKVSAQKCVM